MTNCSMADFSRKGIHKLEDRLVEMIHSKNRNKKRKTNRASEICAT
jgi:hypothetical protein